MVDSVAREWDGAAVRKWLDSRIVAARADQVRAERAGYGFHDDCDKASAEEMVCSQVKTTDSADAVLRDLKALLDRDTFIWRGVYDDTRFDRHVRSYIRKLTKMAKTNDGFAKTAHYQ
jgi:hypothetical protein